MNWSFSSLPSFVTIFSCFFSLCHHQKRDKPFFQKANYKIDFGIYMMFLIIHFIIDRWLQKWISKIFEFQCSKTNQNSSTVLRQGSFPKNAWKIKHLSRPDKNCYYLRKSKIPVINLVVGSRYMIEVSKYMSLRNVW